MRYRQYRAHFTKKEVHPITGKVKTTYVGSVDFFADKSEPLVAIAYRRANREQQDSTLIEIVKI